jgi:hypothetical protein
MGSYQIHDQIWISCRKMYSHIMTPTLAVILSKIYSQVCIRSLNYTPDTLDNVEPILVQQDKRCAQYLPQPNLELDCCKIIWSGQLDIGYCTRPVGQHHRVLGFQLLHVCTLSSCRGEMWCDVPTTNGLVRGSSDNHLITHNSHAAMMHFSPTRLGWSLNKPVEIAQRVTHDVNWEGRLKREDQDLLGIYRTYTISRHDDNKNRRIRWHFTATFLHLNHESSEHCSEAIVIRTDSTTLYVLILSVGCWWKRDPVPPPYPRLLETQLVLSQFCKSTK